MSNDVMNFDLELLRQLRSECELHAIDVTRAKLIPDSDGQWLLRFDAPVIDINAVLPGVPSNLQARSAGQAEGLMLTWLKRIQVAERQLLRTGVCGWSSVDIRRRPITEAELSAYRARIENNAVVARLQAQLTEVLETTAKDARVKAAHDDLQSRYGLSIKQPAKTHLCPPAPNSPKRKTVSRIAK